MVINDKKFSLLLPNSEHPTLSLTISMPEIKAEHKGVAGINAFYEKRKNRLVRYYRRQSEKIKNGSDLLSTVSLEHQITESSDGLISILFTSRQRLGRCRSTYYSAEVWDIKSGYLFSDRDFFAKYGMSRDDVFSQVSDEIAQSNIHFYSNVRFRLRRYYSPDNYCIKDGCPVLFYQPGTLCDSIYGLVKFQLNSTKMPI